MFQRQSRAWEEWTDRLVGSDPGLNRLVTALRAVVSVATAIGAEWLFVHFTGALEAPGPPAKVAGQHHQVLVVAMLLGGVVGNMTGFGVNDATPGAQLLSLLFAPVPVIAALAVGLLLGGVRPVALISFAVLLGLGAWARRFGPRGQISAVLLFIGDFIGFFLHGPFALGDLGWLAAEVVVAVVAIIPVRFALFFPRPLRARRRTVESYMARARRVAALALAVFENSGRGSSRSLRSRQLHRQLVRLNEAALMIDALVARRVSGDRIRALEMHQLVFDIELGLTNMARFAEALADEELEPQVHEGVARVFEAVRDGDAASAAEAAGDLRDELAGGAVPLGGDPSTTVILHRLAGTVEEYARAVSQWAKMGSAAPPVRDGAGRERPLRVAPGSEDPATEDGGVGFEPAVTLNNAGWLPGASEVSARAAGGAGGGAGHRRWNVSPAARAGVQTAVAVGASVAAGDALSPQRFYWAVLAAFISFLGVSHAMEQVRKAAYRVVGTLVGIVLGSFIVRLVGHHTNWSLAVILVFLFLGVYLFHVNYTFMAIAITVIVSQLYVDLGEFSNSLLLLRLEETAIGAVIAMVTSLVILPVKTRRVVSVALADEIRAICNLVANAVEHITDRCSSAPMRSAARAVDSAYQALLSSAQPLRWSALGEVHQRLGTTLAAASAARNYSRNLVFDARELGNLPEEISRRLQVATDCLQASAETLVESADDGAGGVYVRSASLFDEVERSLTSQGSRLDPARLVIRDFQLLDGSLARLAEAQGLDVTSLDVDRRRALLAEARPSAGQ